MPQIGECWPPPRRSLESSWANSCRVRDLAGFWLFVHTNLRGGDQKFCSASFGFDVTTSDTIVGTTESGRIEPWCVVHVVVQNYSGYFSALQVLDLFHTSCFFYSSIPGLGV